MTVLEGHLDNSVSSIVPKLASAGDGYKLTVANQKIIA
jgi:hypothetical protein